MPSTPVSTEIQSLRKVIMLKKWEWVGRGLEQAALVEGVPARGRGLELDEL